ncbi:MAG: insulinase family protein, partial [Phycisphaerae bacterium]|nr:insulinase family protein [Phycisphaerae bacterium]
MSSPNASAASEYFHGMLDSGVEFAADLLPGRKTVALCVRLLSGLSDEPDDLTGISAIVGQVLAKGTEKHDGRGLADAFDTLGAQWGIGNGRQTTMLRAVCLPEFVHDVVALVGEMFRQPTFPDDACRVAVELAQQDLKHLEDDPHGLLRRQIQRLTLGPVWGRHPDGTAESLARMTPELIRAHWRRTYHSGRFQVAVAGPIEPTALADTVARTLGGLGSADLMGREDAEFDFTPAQEHQSKDLKQEYLAITLPGLPRTHPDFPIERVLLGVLSGGMSGRLFTEVREKQG